MNVLALTSNSLSCDQPVGFAECLRMLGVQAQRPNDGVDEVSQLRGQGDDSETPSALTSRFAAYKLSSKAIIKPNESKMTNRSQSPRSFKGVDFDPSGIPE